MKVFVKTVLLSGLGVGCLALGSGAQPPSTPPVPPAPPVQPAIVGGQSIAPLPSPLVPGVYSGTTIVRQGDHGWTVFVAEDSKAIGLARKMVEAKDEEEKDKLRKQLVDALNKAFDERQKRHEKEIAALESQVKKLKEMVSKRKENRDEIIEERLKQLERDASGLGW